MLTVEAAKKAGIDACIDKLGRSFVVANKETFTYGWGETDDGLYCVVCVDDSPLPELEPGILQLDGGPPPKYHASCIVNLENGALTFKEVVCPTVQ